MQRRFSLGDVASCSTSGLPLLPIHWSPVATCRVNLSRGQIFKYAWVGRAEKLVPARESMTLQELLPLALSFFGVRAAQGLNTAASMSATSVDFHRKTCSNEVSPERGKAFWGRSRCKTALAVAKPVQEQWHAKSMAVSQCVDSAVFEA